MREDGNFKQIAALDRRAFLAAAAAAFLAPRPSMAQPAISRPVVSEDACPLETIHPVARDGHRGLAVLRKPPGGGRFPVVVWFHGGITTRALPAIQRTTRDLATGSRFLAAGYVFAASTYRSRDIDPQSADAAEDARATVEHLRALSFADPRSLIVGGCSGGGDLALQVAARTDVCAVVAEEPASVLMSGVFHKGVPRKGERFTPEDSLFAFDEGRRYYTPDLQVAFRAKLADIRAPILIVQGDVDRPEIRINRFNADVLLPELRAVRRAVEVRSYPGQSHCFCDASGVRRSVGIAAGAPMSWPAAALQAFQDIDRFCRRHVKTMPRALDAGLVTFEPVDPVAP